MKKFVSLAIVLSCLLLVFAPKASACFNMKYVHQGVTAVPVMDFTIVLIGERTPINIYMDSTGYRFTDFSYWFDGGYTYLKWFDPVDPTGVPVDPTIGIPYCTWMYIGWEVGEPPAPVILAYWTDANGNPIYPFGWVKEMWHEVYPLPNPWLWIYYTIEFDSAAIDSVYYKIFPAPLTLDQMTQDNPDLWPPWDQMTPLYTGGPYPLAYGDSIGWALPGVAPGDYVVFVYRGFCDNIFWDFGQHLIEQEGPVFDLWETPEGGNTYFEFGCPPQNPTIPPIPADFFGPGSDPFDGRIDCRGEPVETSPPGVLGPTDTIVEREPAELPSCPSTDSVETQIIELNLVSTAPITISYFGGTEYEDWYVRVCLSDVVPPPGYTIFSRDCQEGGTFHSELQIYPRFIFNKVSNPATEVILDFGNQGLPPVEYDILNGNWLFDDPGFGVIRSMGGELVSHCWDIPSRPIGPSGVDLIPGLMALPCDDCAAPPASFDMPFTTFMAPDTCARQDAVPPTLGGEPIPTLTEWGFLILGLLLLAFGTVALIRRRKVALSKTM
jgi:hypothetical protein